MKRSSWILGLVLITYLISRLYNITAIPASVYWDEASIAVNARYVLETGRDEWGDLLPLHFRAFGEFKLPVYIYSVSLAQAIFGDNILAVRLPSVFFFLFSIILIYLITYRLLNSEKVALFTSFIFAFSPWGFIFSRTGYEATAGLFFYLTGFWFLISNYKLPKNIIIASVFFILSMYSYNSYRIVAPLTFVLLLTLNSDVKAILLKGKYYLILAIVLFSVCVFPIYRLYKYDFGGVRLQQVAITGNSINKLQTVFKNIYLNLSPDFLFLTGDPNPRSQIPGFGQLFIVSLPLIAFGLYALIRARSRSGLMIILMTFIGIIPAVITREVPHALRSFSAFPFLCIIAASGLHILYLSSKKRKAIYYLFVILFVINFASYFKTFITEYNLKFANEWQYVYKEVFTTYKDDFDNYDKVIVTDEFGQPYIFALYYLKIPPSSYLDTVSYNDINRWGQSKVLRFSNFEFTSDAKIDDDLSYLIFTDEEIEGLDLINKLGAGSEYEKLYVYEKNK